MVSLAHSVPSTRKPSLDDRGQPKVKKVRMVAKPEQAHPCDA